MWGKSWFSNEYSIFPTAFVEETFLSPLNNLNTIVTSQLAIYLWVYFQTVSYMSTFTLISHFLDYSNFPVSVEIRQGRSCNFILSYTCFDYSKSWCFCVNFKINLSVSAERASWNLDWDCVESVNQFMQNWYINNI